MNYYLGYYYKLTPECSDQAYGYGRYMGVLPQWSMRIQEVLSPENLYKILPWIIQGIPKLYMTRGMPMAAQLHDLCSLVPPLLPNLLTP